MKMHVDGVSMSSVCSASHLEGKGFLSNCYAYNSWLGEPSQVLSSFEGINKNLVGQIVCDYAKHWAGALGRSSGDDAKVGIPSSSFFHKKVNLHYEVIQIYYLLHII